MSTLTDRGHDEARCPLWTTSDQDCNGECRRSYEEQYFAGESLTDRLIEVAA